MPSFLNKVFGYKKHDDKVHARPSRDTSDTLLDGKYEAIPPVSSPSAATFADAHSGRDPDRDALGFSIFKPKFRGVSQNPAQKHSEAAPHLTLQLPGPRGNPDSRALGAVFEADPDSYAILDDVTIATKRLNPLEALILVRACAQVIVERGLETPGVMHPHWFSASPDTQRKLISLFIRSLSPQSRITTLSPTPTSPASTFENELQYARSPHDVAAVLRWGLRHLALEDGHFSKESTEWAWYNSFLRAERNASYPPKAFSELLLPQLPASHVELLTATLDLISSLASHAEVNSISGSKLSKFLGLWLLLATRAEQSDNWSQFYARWERAGRILEHLFLARLREESFAQRLPTRLQELVKHYPYNKGSLLTEDGLLSRPRFSTRQYDALFVRVETLLTHSSEQPKQHPIQLLLDAFQIPVESPSGNVHAVFWNTLRTVASEDVTPDAEGPQFSRILVDETIQLLSSIPADSSAPTTPALLTSPVTEAISRRRSSSLSKAFERALPRSNANDRSTPVSPTSPTSPVISDWAQFSLSGFGDTPPTQPLAAILGQDNNDIEITQPRLSRKSSRHRGKSRTRRQRSKDQEPSDNLPSSRSELETSVVETKLGLVRMVQIDEAFVDFWSDAIVDPISANWPPFVICGLKQIPTAEQSIRWLIVEQTYNRQQPPRVPSPDGRRGRSPRPSFRSDISGFRINTMFSSARKRFSAFSKSVTDLDPKKSGAKTPITGELGEILVEEPMLLPAQSGHDINSNALAATAVTVGATSDIADQLNADEISTATIAAAPPADALKEEFNPVQEAAEARSVEPTPQSGGMYNGSPEAPRWSVKASEDGVSDRQDSPRALDAVSPKVNNTSDPVAEVAPLAADTIHLPSTQGNSDPTAFTSGPVLTAGEPVAESQAEQRVDGEVENRLVEPAAQLDASAAESPDADAPDAPREDAGVVAIPPTLETVAAVATTPVAQPIAVGDAALEPAVGEPHATQEPSGRGSADLKAASTVKSLGQREIDGLVLASAVIVQGKDTVTEAGAQLESDLIPFGVEEAKEVADIAEIPTPAPEPVALVEETPGPGVIVATCVTERVVEDAAPQTATATAEVQGSFVAQTAEAPAVRTIPAVDAATLPVTVGTEHAVGQVPDLEVHPAQGTINAENAEAENSAGNTSTVQATEDVTPVEPEAQTAPERIVANAPIPDTQVSTPVPEPGVLINDTPGPVVTAEANGAIDVAPAVALLSNVAVEPKMAVPLQEADGVAASATIADEVIAVKADVEPMTAAPDDGAPAHSRAPDSVQMEGVGEDAVDDATEEGAPVTALTSPEPIDANEVSAATEEAQACAAAVPSVSEPDTRMHAIVVPEAPAVGDVPIPSSASGAQSDVGHPGVGRSAARKAEGRWEGEPVRPTANAFSEVRTALDGEPGPRVSKDSVMLEDARDVDAKELEGAAEPEAIKEGAPVLVTEVAAQDTVLVVETDDDVVD